MKAQGMTATTAATIEKSGLFIGARVRVKASGETGNVITFSGPAPGSRRKPTATIRLDDGRAIEATIGQIEALPKRPA